MVSCGIHPKINFTMRAQAAIMHNEFEYYNFKVIATSP